MRKGIILPSGRLRALRIERSQTQEKIAELLGLNDTKSYRQWESEGLCPKGENLVALAELFNVSTDYLLGLSDYKHIGDENLSEVTGLSKAAIEKLGYLTHSKEPGGEMYSAVLSLLIESDHFMELMHQIRFYLSRMEEIKTELNTVYAAEPKMPDVLSLRQRTEKFVVTDILSDLLDELSPVPDFNAARIAAQERYNEGGSDNG